jgi:hypothetical protein
VRSAPHMRHCDDAVLETMCRAMEWMYQVQDGYCTSTSEGRRQGPCNTTLQLISTCAKNPRHDTAQQDASCGPLLPQGVDRLLQLADELLAQGITRGWAVQRDNGDALVLLAKGFDKDLKLTGG